MFNCSKLQFKTEFHCLKAAEPLRGESLPLAFKMSLRVPDAHLINLGRMKDCVKLLPPSDFEPRSHGLVIKLVLKLVLKYVKTCVSHIIFLVWKAKLDFIFKNL